MTDPTGLPLDAVYTQLQAQRLPRWRELPDLELYMDQVLGLVGRYLGTYPGFDEKGLTAAMVNNYVKLGALPPPQKKRYNRSHLARLLMICLLKPSLPIAAIRDLLNAASRQDEEAFYDGFCALFEEAGSAAAAACERSDAGTETAVLRAALRAQAEQALALKLCGTLAGRDGDA